MDDFYAGLIRQLKLETAAPFALPEGVTAQRRGNHVFVMNLKPMSQPIPLGKGRWRDLLTNTELTGSRDLPGYGTWVHTG